jgi:hypothetical protein
MLIGSHPTVPTLNTIYYTLFVYLDLSESQLAIILDPRVASTTGPFQVSLLACYPSPIQYIILVREKKRLYAVYGI